MAGFFKRFAQKTVDAVKEVSVEDAGEKLDIAGDIATIGIFLVLSIGAFRGASHKRPKALGFDIPDKSEITINNYFYGEVH